MNPILPVLLSLLCFVISMQQPGVAAIWFRLAYHGWKFAVEARWRLLASVALFVAIVGGVECLNRL